MDPPDNMAEWRPWHSVLMALGLACLFARADHLKDCLALVDDWTRTLRSGFAEGLRLDPEDVSFAFIRLTHGPGLNMELITARGLHISRFPLPFVVDLETEIFGNPGGS